VATRLVTGPIEEPLTLLEAKDHLRVTGTADDYKILGLIIAVREWAESFTHRRFITQTWDWTLDDYPATDWGGWIDVPFGALQSVSAITYLDSAGDTQTLTGSPAQFQYDIGSDPGRIAALYGEAWPSARGDLSGITARITVGYGLAAAVPRSIKLPMLLYLEALYDKDERTMKLYMNVAEALLLPHRIYSIV
jgi:uncharacterized phiE125 gp8 family phage protein